MLFNYTIINMYIFNYTLNTIIYIIHFTLERKIESKSPIQYFSISFW